MKGLSLSPIDTWLDSIKKENIDISSNAIRYLSDLYIRPRCDADAKRNTDIQIDKYWIPPVLKLDNPFLTMGRIQDSKEVRICIKKYKNKKLKFNFND